MLQKEKCANQENVLRKMRQKKKNLKKKWPKNEVPQFLFVVNRH